jgi:hypothetical protein
LPRIVAAGAAAWVIAKHKCRSTAPSRCKRGQCRAQMLAPHRDENEVVRRVVRISDHAHSRGDFVARRDIACTQPAGGWLRPRPRRRCFHRASSGPRSEIVGNGRAISFRQAPRRRLHDRRHRCPTQAPSRLRTCGSALALQVQSDTDLQPRGVQVAHSRIQKDARSNAPTFRPLQVEARTDQYSSPAVLRISRRSLILSGRHVVGDAARREPELAVGEGSLRKVPDY